MTTPPITSAATTTAPIAIERALSLLGRLARAPAGTPGNVSRLGPVGVVGGATTAAAVGGGMLAKPCPAVTVLALVVAAPPATVGSGAGNVTDTSVMSATGMPSARCACWRARPNADARAHSRILGETLFEHCAHGVGHAAGAAGLARAA